MPLAQRGFYGRSYPNNANTAHLFTSLSRSQVLDGFTLGAVWLVFTTQFPHVTGVAPPPGMHYVQSALWILLHPLKWNLGSLWVALMTIVCLQGGKKISPLFPGALVALAIGAIHRIVRERQIRSQAFPLLNPRWDRRLQAA